MQKVDGKQTLQTQTNNLGAGCLGLQTICIKILIMEQYGVVCFQLNLS